MEKREIINRAHAVGNKEDLLVLLNDLVKDELGEESAFSFSMKQLSYYSNPNNIRGRYNHFSIPKKNKKGVRPIDAPSKGLNNILYFLNIILKALYTPSDYAMGFTEGRSVVDNAIRHINQNYVFNTDLKDFFTTIEQPRVRARLQLPPFNFNKSVAGFIAGLCSIRVTNDDGTFKYVLPQGAPTSPIITNAICDKLDHRLAGLARRFNLHYTRYADDITFSSMHNVYQEGGEFRAELKRIVEDQRFTMHGEEKTRLQKVGQRQEVTGITVSTKLNTPKKYVKEIRNVLHIWERYGYYEAYRRFYPYYKIEKGHVKKGEPVMENVIYGKLQYLKMVKGEKDRVYGCLWNRFNSLLEINNCYFRGQIDIVSKLNSELDELLNAI
ncbi:MAG: reverse transcriptase family protein [Bacteroidales bacterium]|nr:reverse transcriptase family protein [Bacteroidales bacterium]